MKRQLHCSLVTQLSTNQADTAASSSLIMSTVSKFNADGISYACARNTCSPIKTLSIRVPNSQLESLQCNFSSLKLSLFVSYGARSGMIFVQTDSRNSYISDIESSSSASSRSPRILREKVFRYPRPSFRYIQPSGGQFRKETLFYTRYSCRGRRASFGSACRPVILYRNSFPVRQSAFMIANFFSTTLHPEVCSTQCL